MVSRAIVPTGIEAKAIQFASVCERDGYPDAMLIVKNGRIVRMSLFDAEERQRFFASVDGKLCEYHMPGGGSDG